MSIPAPSFDVELPVELSSEESGEPFLGVSINLSDTGMLVVADEPQLRGTPLRFDFQQFGGTSEVIWTREDKVRGVLLGMKFLSLKRRDRKTLCRILEAPLIHRA